ncbi:MAG: Hsp33 family molecular chaperone HslO [Solobacterium sp.]|nr:Hsp33 family molecular chaperone HslO [Solobacterium sp.]
MNDEIVIAQALNGQIRIHAARTTKMCDDARTAHHCMPTSAAALGRVMTCTAIMASDLKNEEERITAVINGGGPAGTIIVQAYGNGDVRGFIGDPNLYMVREDGHLAVGAAVGNKGTLTVTRDMGLKEPFRGVTELRTGEIGDDFTYYFAISEQTPSVVGVGVLVAPEGHVRAAGGLIYQLMPNASEEAIEYCENIAATQKPVSELIDSGLDLRDIIRTYFPDAEIQASKDVRFHCRCSRKTVRGALAVLKKADLEEMIRDGKGAELHCQYCNTFYSFTTDELKEILEEQNEDR